MPEFKGILARLNEGTDLLSMKPLVIFHGVEISFDGSLNRRTVSFIFDAMQKLQCLCMASIIDTNNNFI